MKNIQQKTNGFQKSEMDKMVRRINRLKKHFDKVSAGDQKTILKMLAEEIKYTENERVKHWLTHFRDILNTIHRGAFEPLVKAEVAANV